MKTRKYSVMMKAFMAAAVMFLISNIAFAQTIEERKGGTSTYSVAAGDPTDEYRWTIGTDGTAPTVVPAPDGGTGTIADPYYIDWTADLTSIQVTWDAGTDDINSDAGQVTVQKQITTGATCPGTVQTMDISLWSTPDAAIDPAEVDQTVCSADAIGGSITINLAGAPDGGQNGAGGFSLVYDVAVSDPGLTVSGANGAVGDDQTLVELNNGTISIPLPDALLNATASAQTYTITLNTIQDDFTEAPVAVAGVYTITVNPVPTTGIITSTGSLTRR